jgi:hypothetical protein
VDPELNVRGPLSIGPADDRSFGKCGQTFIEHDFQIRRCRDHHELPLSDRCIDVVGLPVKRECCRDLDAKDYQLPEKSSEDRRWEMNKQGTDAHVPFYFQLAAKYHRQCTSPGLETSIKCRPKHRRHSSSPS